MTRIELYDYIKKVSEYIEYSFFKNSTEIMETIMNKGLGNVLEILMVKELNKGIYQCETVWNISPENKILKTVNIDITNEMIFITEVI